MTEKIRIAIVVPDMIIGGVEKALLSLLEAIGNREELQISLLLFRKHGALLSDIPSWVEVKEIRGGKLDSVRQKTADFLAKRGLGFLFNLFKLIYHSLGNHMNSLQKNLGVNLDVVIAYKDGAATWYTANKITAKTKIAFIHTDFAQAAYSPSQESKVYAQFDRIYCASAAGRESFLRLMPELSDRVDVFYNILDRERLNRLAKEGLAYPDTIEGIRILTIGRLTQEKGLDKAVRALHYLKSAGYKVRWYVAGKGREEQNLRTLTEKLGVQGDFVFLGELNNPYRMLAECDIYVQPSNYEGYGLALAEALIFARPAVASSFSGAGEQIRQGETGIITGMTPEALYEGIKLLLDNDNLRQQIMENLNKQESGFQENQITRLSDLLFKWGLSSY